MERDAQCQVVIAGGGHAGLLLGCALAQHDFRVMVVEPQPAARIAAAPPDGRSLALLAGSVAAARRFGVWAAIAPAAAPIERVEVTDVAGGGRVRYDSLAHGSGPFGFGIEHVALRAALLTRFQEVAGTGALVRDQIAGLERNHAGIVARLASGGAIVAPLIVGADGRGSRVRALAGIGVDRWPYDQHALALVLRHQRRQRGMVREWLRPGGPLATLPLPSGRLGITWAERSAEAQHLVALPAPQLAAALSAATEGALDPIEIESGPSSHPLAAQHARGYVAPRVALVGDAAHGVHPIHAQGFNMGVADVAALADALLHARTRGLDLGSGEALLPYARARRGDNTQRLWLTDGLVRLFTAELAPLRAARSLALDAIERLPPLKRLAVRHGMQAAGGGRA